MPAGKETASGDWESFLARPALTFHRAQAKPSLSGKRILITGAGGWIGSALTRALASFAPQHLLLLEASERNLYEMNVAFQHVPAVQRSLILGSVSDRVLLGDIFRRYQPQVVYHAAAFKQVPLMEQNPFAAIENNVIGSSVLVEAAAEHQVEQLILVSTDKAVDPASIMGASKRIAELILLAPPTTATRMKAVRLGNVVGSGGSIVPLFEQQILSGGPVTVTHPEVRRYFVTTEDAVTMLLLVASVESSQGILAPDLGEPVLVQALARYLIARSSSSRSVEVVFTQLRPGDKMCEALFSGRETLVTRAGSPLRSVLSPALPAPELDNVLAQLRQACQRRSLIALLAAISLAVPEYQPSTVIQQALACADKASP